MTYCVALKLDAGLVLASDTRTNAGLDNISSFRKMHVWRADDRVIVLMSAGSLSVTQDVTASLDEAIQSAGEADAHLMNAPSMHAVGKIIGRAVRAAHDDAAQQGNTDPAVFSANFILGGQIGSGATHLLRIYPEGNSIEAGDDTPYFQIGEHKYGKPILDRVHSSQLRLGQGAKLLLLSFDSTLRSNLSVGLPIDLMMYADGSFEPQQVRIEESDPYFDALSQGWSKALGDAFEKLDEFPAKKLMGRSTRH